MSDQITQTFKKSFLTSHKRIADRLKMSIPWCKRNLRHGKRHGKKAISVKRLLAAIFYKIKSRCAWRHLPDFFGNWRTIYGCYRKLAAQHFWKNLYEKLLSCLQKENFAMVKRVIFDGSLIPAKNGGMQAKHNPRAQNKSVVSVMFMVNGKGLGLNLVIAPGTTHDSTLMRPLYHRSAHIFKHNHPSVIHADKGFDAGHSPFLGISRL